MFGKADKVGLSRPAERLKAGQRFLTTVPWNEKVIVVQRGDDVHADASIGEPRRQDTGQSDSFQT